MNPEIKNFFSRSLTCGFIFFLFSLSSSASAAEQGEAARIITRPAPPISAIEQEAVKGEAYLNNFYDYSDVVQGSRRGHWIELTSTVGYSKGKINGYASISQLKRIDAHNYTANFGAYLAMKDSYLHYETGFGWHISYIYRLQNLIEYTRKIKNGLFWQFGYNYRAYPTGDNHLIYPGLIYYFGNNYISANYGATIIESRGSGNLGSLRGDLALTQHLHWWFGGAYGEWLYDINGLPANDEFGYLFFTGFTYDISKNISARAGYTYGTEKPKFFKRGLICNLSLKF